MDYAPIVRIIARYGLGGGFFGSKELGEMLATDPDVVRLGCIVLAAGVEGIYLFAKKKGWAT